MENKGIIKFFGVFLLIACLHQLSFSFFAHRFEQKALLAAQNQLDSLFLAEPNVLHPSIEQLKDNYLKANAHQEAYPFFGFSYLECKEKEINLGLDLQGGMSVSLEVSMSDLFQQLAANPQDPKFQEILNATLNHKFSPQEDFIGVFGKNWEQKFPDQPLVNAFYNYNNKDKFPTGISNAEVLDILRKEAAAALEGTEQVLRSRIDQFGVAQPVLQKEAINGRIHLELPGVKDKERVRKLLQATANLEFYEALDAKEMVQSLIQIDQALSLYLYPNYRQEADQKTTVSNPNTEKSAAISNSKNTETLEEGAILDENLALQNTEIPSQTSSIDNEKYYPLFSKISPVERGPVLGYARLSDTATINKMLNESVVKNLIPKNIFFMWDVKSQNDPKTGAFVGLYAIVKEKNQPLIDGKTITEAGVVLDPVSGKPAISMAMDNIGRRIWKEVTTQKLNKYIAITLDARVLSVPVINTVIPDGRSQISGSFSYEEAQDLVNVLKAGALPVPSKITAENYVGPSLGEENIKASFVSFVIAILLVLAYMVFYYGKAGWITNLVLILNLFFLFGLLVTLQATLNLPSIAGLILTIGMAVDANVLIFERIREELKKTKDLLTAVALGYKNAIWSILDANITTVLIGLILLLFGMGPVKGFAITLLIGIGTSFFTGIFLTRLFLEELIHKKQKIHFSTAWSQSWFQNISIDFDKHRKKFYTLSAVLLVFGLLALQMRGLDFGVDFAGGRKFKIVLEEGIDENAIRSVLTNVFVDEKGMSFAPEVKKIENNQNFLITTRYLIGDMSSDTDQKVEQKLMEGLGQLMDISKIQIESMFLVDASVSEQMKSSAWMAVLGALLVIFVYIALRFQKWQYGLAALIALAHDVFLVLTVFALGYKFFPFALEIDQNFIAAILTVVGYSINDTVVVFDRLREYKVFESKKIEAPLLNKALSSTISRTLNTSLTTLFVLLVILVFGGESIKGFVFAMSIGVLVGTYSSLFIAAPLVKDLHNSK